MSAWARIDLTSVQACWEQTAREYVAHAFHAVMP